MEESKSNNHLSRCASYVNHISHIQNIPNKDQTQYLNYSHCIAWSFSKDKKRKFFI